MTTLCFTTSIDADIETIFDLSRSVDAHVESTAHTAEKAISGKTSGLMELGETVMWRARHFGIYLTHESKITEMREPDYFVDEMVSGSFKSFRHEHYFLTDGATVRMTDIISYETPYGFIGRIFDVLFLKRHLTSLINSRNSFLKIAAERSLQNSSARRRLATTP